MASNVKNKQKKPCIFCQKQTFWLNVDEFQPKSVKMKTLGSAEAAKNQQANNFLHFLGFEHVCNKVTNM